MLVNKKTIVHTNLYIETPRSIHHDKKNKTTEQPLHKATNKPLKTVNHKKTQNQEDVIPFFSVNHPSKDCLKTVYTRKDCEIKNQEGSKTLHTLAKQLTDKHREQAIDFTFLVKANKKNDFIILLMTTGIISKITGALSIRSTRKIAGQHIEKGEHMSLSQANGVSLTGNDQLWFDNTGKNRQPLLVSPSPYQALQSIQECINDFKRSALSL